jgi:hypothetical protein
MNTMDSKEIDKQINSVSIESNNVILADSHPNFKIDNK